MKRILIVGADFAGMHAALAAARWPTPQLSDLPGVCLRSE
jgi:succinate dehydrogenase/fumarate reductase flavoprotein subunit